ncbi:MAG: DivIVA domain-containing protein [Defluviitaleaceae bacterium]|nr:DivIVA domain-containing protein [Defluviitaleaceae bacterium]
MEQFTFVKRGYDPEEVDKYITTLEQVIKSYKDKDNAIKNAIISAQRTAEDVVKNAQAEAESYKAQMGEQLVGMRGALDRQRASLQNFQNVNANAIRKCIQELEQFDMNEMFSRIDEMDASIAALQGLETINKDRLLQNQSPGPGLGMDYRSMSRDPMQQDNMMRAPEPRSEHGNYMPREATREALPMRDTGRDALGNTDPYGNLRDKRDMRGLDMERPRDVVRDAGMDMMRARNTMPPVAPPPVSYEPMREQQPYASQSASHSYEPTRDTGRDMVQRESYAPQARDNRDMMSRDDAYPPQQGQGQGHMRDESRDMMRPQSQVREYAPEQPREMIRDTRPRSDFGRDVRRDYGRDMRSDSSRDARRDDYAGGLGRLDDRDQPMREMPPRQYAPDSDNYDDQNLLPPVASLM